MRPNEYRFVCVDGHGVWQALTYGVFADDRTAKEHAARMAESYAYVLVWAGVRRLGLVAMLSKRLEFFPAG